MLEELHQLKGQGRGQLTLVVRGGRGKGKVVKVIAQTEDTWSKLGTDR